MSLNSIPVDLILEILYKLKCNAKTKGLSPLFIILTNKRNLDIFKNNQRHVSKNIVNSYNLCFTGLNNLILLCKYYGNKLIHEKYDYALRLAAQCGNLDDTRFLIELGANIRAYNNYALRMAAQGGHLEVTRLLIEKGADIHEDGAYAVNMAIQCGHLEIVKLLIEKGAHLSSSLIIAAKYNRVEIVKELIEKGIATIYNAFLTAKYYRQSDIIEFLIMIADKDDILKFNQYPMIVYRE